MAVIYINDILIDIVYLIIEVARRILDAYKGTTPFSFGRIYSVIVVSRGNKCFNVSNVY